MDDPSDARLFGRCLVASVVGFATWWLVLRPASAWWILVVALRALAALSFVDGVRSANQPS